jgi:alkanesulfonate monooxygenase SsuD/methylene tetrahydromethanopterin reductase-like flavin-dependent oxidoreductase (luciferase family)
MRPMKFSIFDHLDKRDEPLGKTYEDRLEFIRAAEQYGFHAYHLAEHHGTPLGMAPAPSVFLAAAARETQKIRLGALNYILPLYHPVRLVEEICMLDHLTGGRLQVGLGRGISPIEVGFFGVEGERSREIYHEALAVLIKGLTSDRLDHEGKHFTVRDMPMEMKPLQKPYPALWAGVGDEKSQRFAVRNGINPVALGSVERVRKLVQHCRKVWQEEQESPERITLAAAQPKIGAARHILVADTDADALKLGRTAYEHWYKSLSKLWAERGIPVHSSVIYANFDEAKTLGTVVVGSPRTVRDRLANLIDTCGFDYLLGEFTWGNLTHRQEMKSLRLFGTEVMPSLSRLRSRARATAAA